jgi:hypothetical protein
MSTSLRILAVSAMFATSVVVLTGAANAAPIGGQLAIIKAVPSAKPCNGEAEVGDGAQRLPEALSGGQSLAAR